MDRTPKISLTLYLEGSVPKVTGTVTEEYTLTEKDLNPSDFKGKKTDVKPKVVKKGTYQRKTVEYIPAQKHINMYQEAYDYMSSDMMPAWFNPKDVHNTEQKRKAWKKLSPKERINLHMARIASAERAFKFTFTILED